MKVYSFANTNTGEFLDVRYMGPSEWLEMNTPSECVAVEGTHDKLSVKLDLDTGYVVSHQPAKPDADEFTDWEWDVAAWKWAATKTHAAIERDALEKRSLELSASDWTQLQDVPEATRVLWAPYRQQLRDITSQIGYPLSIQWPESPA